MNSASTRQALVLAHASEVPLTHGPRRTTQPHSRTALLQSKTMYCQGWTVTDTIMLQRGTHKALVQRLSTAPVIDAEDLPMGISHPTPCLNAA